MRLVKLRTADHNYGSKAKDGQVQTSVYAAYVPSSSPTKFTDKLGRERYSKPTSPRVDAVLRPLPGLHSSPHSHQEDISALFRRLRDDHGLTIRGAVLCSDQGHDWDRYLVALRTLFWEMMCDFDMGVFIHTWHAPGQSYLNLVERLMAVFNIIKGAYIQNTLSGDFVPASQQSDLTEAQVAEKTARLFREIVFPFLKKKFEELKFDGRKPNVTVDWPSVRCLSLQFSFSSIKLFFV